jgi:hypothetical protein
VKNRTIKIRLGELRELIRTVIAEGPSGPGVTADPTSPDGFYPYELTRGNDIYSFWYRSPARTPGSDGDPGRPEDAMEYLGLVPEEPEELQSTETETP